MDGALHLYARYLGLALRGQQYRASSVMPSVGNLLITGVEFLGIWALFDRMVKSGDFDRIQLRRRGTVLQLAGHDLHLTHVGRLLQGLVALLWAAHALGVIWTVPKVAFLVVTVLGGAYLFYGLIVLQATLAFWTTESLEVLNILAYGGVETAQYPLSIYRGWFRRFFTVVVLLACVSYFPALAIIGQPDPLGSPAFLHWTAPAAGVLFLLVCLRVWQFGVRHYRSMGS